MRLRSIAIATLAALALALGWPTAAFAATPTATITMSHTALSIGQTSTVTFTFSEPVVGFDLSDISLMNGTLFSLSSGNRITWVATFTPISNVEALSNVMAVNLSGIANDAGEPGVGVASMNYSIDTVRPTASIVVSDTSLLIGESSAVTIQFSEPVTGLSSDDFFAENGTLSSFVTSDNTKFEAVFEPSTNVQDRTNVVSFDNSGVADSAGNAGSGISISNNFAINTTRPMATIVVDDALLTAGETAIVTTTFTEAVAGFTASDFTVTNGSIGDPTSSDGGITWSAVLTPKPTNTATGNVVMLDLAGVIGAADVTGAFGNAGVGVVTSNTYTIAAALVTLSITVAEATIGTGETSLVTFAFSRQVSGFSNANVTVPNGTLSPLASVDGGATFTATFTPTPNVTATSNVISVNVNGVTDAGGTGLGSAVVSSNAFAVSTLVVTPPVSPPTVVAPSATPPATSLETTLPSTGVNTGGIVATAAALILLGGFVFSVRLRRTRL